MPYPRRCPRPWRCPRLTAPDGGRPARQTPTVAAFDFDGTLTDAGSSFRFLVALRGPWPVLRAALGLSPGLVRAALVGGSAADEVKQRLFTRLLGGLDVGEVQRRSRTFARRHLRRHLREDSRRRLEWHRQEGHHIVIVSASPECYVSEAGAELGRRRRGRHTPGGRGRWAPHRGLRGEELPRRGEVRPAGRVPTIAGAVASNGGPQPVLWAYGNSRGDLRLLDAADHGVDAGRLGPLGRLRRFPRLAE